MAGDGAHTHRVKASLVAAPRRCGWPRTVGAILAATLLLAACTGDNAVPVDDAPDGPEAERGESRIQTVATEYRFEPDAWTVPAAEEVTVELVNEGAVEHDWVVLERGVEVTRDSDFHEDDVLWRLAADAGDRVLGTFVIDQSGSYQIVCTVRGRAAHFVAGMVGVLEVGD
jgi:plastocyanin